MSAYPESASHAPNGRTDAAGGILVSGLNWLGDSVMCMPALAALRNAAPSVPVCILVKPALAPLWRMSAAVNSVIEIAGEGPAGTVRTARLVRARRFEKCFVLPQSFRSALIPFLAGIPSRAGVPGHGRAWMLTASVRPSRGDGRRHQMHEYFDIMGLPSGDARLPLIRVPPDIAQQGRKRAAAATGGASGPLVGMFPGAAYGPSKRWPAASFAAVARRLAAEKKCRVVLLGSAGDSPVCEQVLAGAKGSAASLAGGTSLQELAGVLSNCATVVANDSGGMHLAAAVGVPVVGIFGITDPEVTGPVGPGHRIVAAAGVSRSRDLDRESPAAAEALAAIKPDAVFEAAAALLKEERGRNRAC